MTSDKVVHTRLTPTLLTAIDRKAGARGMNRSEYLRALAVADCQRKAPIPTDQLLALVQAASALAELPQLPELAEIRAAWKRYIKANGASWRS